jgi:hypothetical protein
MSAPHQRTNMPITAKGLMSCLVCGHNLRASVAVKFGASALRVSYFELSVFTALFPSRSL